MPRSFSSPFLLYEHNKMLPCFAFCRGALFIYFRKRALEIKVFPPSILPPPKSVRPSVCKSVYSIYIYIYAKADTYLYLCVVHLFIRFLCAVLLGCFCTFLARVWVFGPSCSKFPLPVQIPPGHAP